MKIKNFLILLVPFWLHSCLKNCILNYEIVNTEHKIPHFIFQNRAYKQINNVNYDRYELVNVNEYEIDYIMNIINFQITDSNNATSRIKNEICEYSVQIGGVYDKLNESKLIYLNFDYGFSDFKTINESDELSISPLGGVTQYFYPKDGGDEHFEAVIDTKRDKLIIIHINGEA